MRINVCMAKNTQTYEDKKDRINIMLSPSSRKKADDAVIRLGLRSLSDYVGRLIERDFVDAYESRARLFKFISGRIFLLCPVDPSHPNWKASTIKDRILVRASNEQEARAFATTQTSISVKILPNEETVYNPWDYTNHATCVDVTDSANVPQEGMSGIIKVLK